MRYFKTLSDNFLPNYSSLPEPVFHDIVLKQSWVFFKKANNCDKKIGYLRSSLDTLDLLKADSDHTWKLKNLIDAINDLLNWKLYFQPGVPVTPRHILEVNDPFKIVKKILELNESAYTQTEELFELLKKLEIGLEDHEEDEIEKDDLALMTKLKLMALDYAATCDFDYAFELASGLLDLGANYKFTTPLVFNLVRDNWISFFQLVKNDFGEADADSLNKKLTILCKLMLVVPSEFNSTVLEHWQMLNTEKYNSEMMAASHASETVGNHRSPLTPRIPDNGKPTNANANNNTLSRLQRSIQSSANEVLQNSEGGDLGKNIIGWIVGAQ
ncbi:unnamed protein product [Ambrosiozyma monospora]|uniref:Unnamed protein product n=1 Tax=Ambrosiozyma monospora TaxID=43982 RepID=A0ACB5T295_AMBMO|nr:unnamed protein product [Ambrosiozyma monospora]